MAIVVVFATAAMAEVNIIKGYAKNEFAIKGEVEQRLDTIITNIADQQALIGLECKLKIAIIGSADSAGRSQKNDQLAKMRADEVAAVLSYEFPNAHINVWSRGDEDNVRQVKVEYEFILPTPAPVVSAININGNQETEQAAAKQSDKFRVDLLIIGMLVIFALALIAIYRLVRAGKEYQQKVEEKQRTEYVEGEFDGKKYQVAIVRKNGYWVSPFTQPSGAVISGPLAGVRNETARKFKLATKPGKVGKFYQKQIKELITKGVITPKEV